ncbi:hypothetical protein L9F63_018475, partial [Diploptera punctata]
RLKNTKFEIINHIYFKYLHSNAVNFNTCSHQKVLRIKPQRLGSEFSVNIDLKILPLRRKAAYKINNKAFPEIEQRIKN